MKKNGIAVAKIGKDLSRGQLAKAAGGGGIVRLIRGSEADPPPETDLRTIALAD